MQRLFVRFSLVLLLIATTGPAWCRERALAPVPAEIASSHFTVTIDGRATPVCHAAANLYFLNFDAGKHRKISVTADTDDFWARGVEVQPWRLGIRPQRQGRTITFELKGPAQIAISRPGDYLGDAEMLYLFANPPEQHPPVAPQPGLRYFGPGVHRENIDAATGDTIYLAPDAVLFGSLNLWGVDRVKVFGRGVIVYDGPQNPTDDDGWMHKRNWHCIVMDSAHDISIEGITCVVRSRTWQIQMKDSRRIAFDNIKVIGANTGNANADGMDWLGGGDTTVRNSFFRAADDIFAMQTSWEGYGPVAFAVQGSPVTNILVENNVLSTSISNIVRAGWPEKNFEGGNFTMRHTDVLHMGMGGCGIPFALMELWADPNGRGQSAGFHFSDIRLEDWYSLVQLRQPTPGIREVTFTDIAALELPSRVPSVLSGHVEGVRFDNIVAEGTLVGSDADLPLDRANDAAPATFADTGPKVHIVSDIDASLIRPGQKVHFRAVVDGAPSESYDYAWSFGDGTRAKGNKVSHKFPDTGGTLWDGSGRFRVLLHVATRQDRHTWLAQPVVVSDALSPAQPVAAAPAHVSYTYAELGQAADATPPPRSGVQQDFTLPAGHGATNYTVSLEGFVDAPTDGAYAFVVFASDRSRTYLGRQGRGRGAEAVRAGVRSRRKCDARHYSVCGVGEGSASAEGHGGAWARGGSFPGALAAAGTCFGATPGLSQSNVAERSSFTVTPSAAACRTHWCRRTARRSPAARSTAQTAAAALGSSAPSASPERHHRDRRG